MPTQFEVLGLVNHTHPAAAELLDDAVMRDGLTDHGNAGTQGCHVRSAARTKSTEAYGGYRAKLTQCLASCTSQFTRVPTGDWLLVSVTFE